MLKNLKIPEYNETNPLAKEIGKSVIRYDKHPCVTAVRKLNIRSHFEFTFANIDKVLKEIKKLNPGKSLIYLQTMFVDFLMNL